jgi:hypothetical protein
MITRIAGFHVPRARILVRVAGWTGLPPRLAMIWSEDRGEIQKELDRLDGIEFSLNRRWRQLGQPEDKRQLDELRTYKGKLKARIEALPRPSDEETRDMPAGEETREMSFPTLQRQLQKEGLPPGVRPASPEMKDEGYDYEGTTLVGDVVGIWRPNKDSPWVVELPSGELTDLGVLED